MGVPGCVHRAGVRHVRGAGDRGVGGGRSAHGDRRAGRSGALVAGAPVLLPHEVGCGHGGIVPGQVGGGRVRGGGCADRGGRGRHPAAPLRAAGVRRGVAARWVGQGARRDRAGQLLRGRRAGRGCANLPADVTFTTRLHAKAVLYAPPPPPTGRRGHPAWKGARLGTPAQIAATTTWRTATVACYGQVRQVLLAEIGCRWWGSLHRTPVRLVLVRDPTGARPDLALITTDPHSPAEAIVARYADRWSIEQTIKDGKDLLGVGDAQNRLPKAVARTAPLMFLTLTILVCWYARVGNAETDLTTRRELARWYRHKEHISVTDLLIAFRSAGPE